MRWWHILRWNKIEKKVMSRWYMRNTLRNMCWSRQTRSMSGHLVGRFLFASRARDEEFRFLEDCFCVLERRRKTARDGVDVSLTFRRRGLRSKENFLVNTEHSWKKKIQTKRKICRFAKTFITENQTQKTKKFGK